jgi:CheY-like chemotaxis protein
MITTPLRVLIVDDNVDSARLLMVLLQRDGQEAWIAVDGPAALAAASVQKPDIVLLDLSLPGMSGLDVAAELRRDPEHSGCILIAMSGHGREWLPSPSPFDSYFAKPVDFKSLLAYLRELPARQKPRCREPAVA